MWYQTSILSAIRNNKTIFSDSQNLSIMSLFSKTATLVLLAHLDPRIHDALIPHTHFTEKSLHIMASSIVKSIAQKITNADTAGELNSAGKNLFKSGVESMDYEDDFWPIHPKPWYRDELIQFGPSPEPWFLNFGGEEVMLNPQPLPPHEQSYYGALITMLADAVSLENVSGNLRDIGASLMKQTNRDDKVYASKSQSYSTVENGK